VLTLATSYGQLAAITALRIAVLRQKQNFVKSTFSWSTVFLLVGSSSEGSVFKRDAAVCSQRRTTSETCPTMFTQLRSNTNKSLITLSLLI
jgi:hypothetical protein